MKNEKIEMVRAELALQIERDYNNPTLANEIRNLQQRGIVFHNVDAIIEDMNQFGMTLESAVEKALDDVIDDYM